MSDKCLRNGDNENMGEQQQVCDVSATREKTGLGKGTKNVTRSLPEKSDQSVRGWDPS